MDLYQTLYMMVKITKWGRCSLENVYLSPNNWTLLKHLRNIISKFWVSRSFLMSLKYHYRKFQPRRLKFDQDMATNPWPVIHHKGTGDDNKYTGLSFFSKFGVLRISNWYIVFMLSYRSKTSLGTTDLLTFVRQSVCPDRNPKHYWVI